MLTKIRSTSFCFLPTLTNLEIAPLIVFKMFSGPSIKMPAGPSGKVSKSEGMSAVCLLKKLYMVYEGSLRSIPVVKVLTKIQTKMYKKPFVLFQKLIRKKVLCVNTYEVIFKKTYLCI